MAYIAVLERKVSDARSLSGKPPPAGSESGILGRCEGEVGSRLGVGPG